MKLQHFKFINEDNTTIKEREALYLVNQLFVQGLINYDKAMDILDEKFIIDKVILEEEYV